MWYLRQMLEIVVIVFVVVVAFAIPGLIVVWLLRQIKGGKIGTGRGLGPDDFRGTLRAAGAQEVSGALLLEREGVAYRFVYLANSEGPSHIRVSRPIEPGSGPGLLPELPVMNLREENDRDRLGKSLHLNRELQTGDALFDARIYIECDDRGGAARRMLSSPALRKGVTGLLALGFSHVGFRMHSQALVTSWTVGSRAFDRSVVEGAVQRLAQIGESLPAFRKVPTSAPVSPGGWIALGSWGLAAVAMIFFFIADERWPALGSGLDQLTVMIAVVMFFLQLGVLWLLIKGHSRALRHLFWAMLSGFLLTPCLSRGGLLTANGSGDTALTTYERPLQHKRKVEGEDSTSYYFYFEPVPGVSDSSMKIPVSSGRYRSTSVGDVWQLTVGAGQLGTPWLLEMSQVY